MRIVSRCALVLLAGSLALPANAVDVFARETRLLLREGGMPAPVGTEFQLQGREWRIDGSRTDPDDPSIVLYRFSMRTADSTWINPCLPDHERQQEGFPLPGRWTKSGRFKPDRRQVTLTCSSGAYGKCIRFGYRPWKSHGGDSLTLLYEACVRMVRADYCGDDKTATVDGMRINVFDDAGVRRATRDEDYVFEAGWSPAGAVCVRRTRVLDMLDLDALVRRCPRLKSAVGAQCDERRARSLGAVLFNKSIASE